MLSYFIMRHDNVKDHYIIVIMFDDSHIVTSLSLIEVPACVQLVFFNYNLNPSNFRG
jgi:hypothetical protein